MPNPDPAEPKPKRRYHLSGAGRAALRAAIVRVKPWEHSTGPRTAQGKLATRQNALKHGYHARVPLPEAAAFKAFMKAYRRASSGAGQRPTPGPPVW